MLSQMVPFFLLSMAAYKTSRERLLIGSLYYFHQSGDGHLSYHREQNSWYHMKEHGKLVKKLMSKVTYFFVNGHLSRKQTVWGFYSTTHNRGSRFLLDILDGFLGPLHLVRHT